MVKNHALKNTARARKAATGETLPVALRNSDTTSGSKPVIHLGNGVCFDLNKENPNLLISGNIATGKTTLVRHILREAMGSGMNPTVFADYPKEYIEAFPGVAMVDAGARSASADLMLDALAMSARGGHRNEFPKLIVIDSLNSISEDGQISLQILARSGPAVNIHLVIVSHNALGDGILKSNSRQVSVGRNGLCSMEGAAFQIGEPVRSEVSNSLRVGDKAHWDLTTGNLMILGSPGIGKTELAKQIAREALLAGKSVTVMASPGNDASWRKTMGNTVRVFSGISGDAIDKLTARGLDEGDDACVLIVDGFMLEEGRPMTLNERVSQSAFINVLRGGHVKVIAIGTQTTGLESLFDNAVLLSESLPKNPEAMAGLSLNQMLGTARRNRAEDEERFTRCGVGHGWMIGLRRDVYEQFEFTA